MPTTKRAVPEGHKGLQRLEALRKENADPAWVNRDVYRLMYKADLYVTAYERIKSIPGNMTAGMDGSTLDGYGLETIQKTITVMRNESFRFSRGRRVYIPKTGGKKRPLTIAPPREKVVQEVIRMILEGIYDSPYGATFSDRSHGFRGGRGTHSALKEVRQWQGVNWLIEGDIKGCFENVDHHILMGLLRKRIADERFLNLIWKALRAGYTDGRTGDHYSSLSGTPQGGIMSPILANIYLHELDSFVEALKIRYERGDKRRRNPDYRRLESKASRLRKEGGDPKKIAGIKRKMREMPSVDPNDPSYIRLHYVRYADDWVIGVTGPKSLASQIKGDIAGFLEEHLNLTLSLGKTHVRHAKTEDAFFLGTLIRVGATAQKIGYQVRNGQRFRRRSTGWSPIMRAPMALLIRKLQLAGFCDAQGNPTPKLAWVDLDAVDMIQRYNAVLRGVTNYYRFVNNFSGLRSIQHILHFSAAKTLATKWRMRSIRRVFSKFGKELSVTSVGPSGTKQTARFELISDWGVDLWGFLTNGQGVTGELTALRQFNRYTRSHLGSPCAICGRTDSVHMHHVRHIRKAGSKVLGFKKLLAQLNRKQIPACHQCHTRIHNGEYDGAKPSDLAYPPT